jgi:hypothetical protein
MKMLDFIKAEGKTLKNLLPITSNLGWCLTQIP